MEGAVAGTPIRFVASTGGTKRDGRDLNDAPWLFENFRRNPVFLWVHDYLGERLPLGRAEIVAEGYGGSGQAEFGIDVVFDQEDDFARSVEGKYRRGFLHSVSVGWDDVDEAGIPTRVSRAAAVARDLLDISGVPVPGDPEALMERQRVGLRGLWRELDEVLGTDSREATDGDGGTDGDGERGAREREEDGESQWSEVAASMVALFAKRLEDPDEDRLRAYNALLPRYRRLGKIAPEFRRAEELVALTPELVRGLFLEGEAELAGVVFSEPEPDPLEGIEAQLRAMLGEGPPEVGEHLQTLLAQADCILGGNDDE